MTARAHRPSEKPDHAGDAVVAHRRSVYSGRIGDVLRGVVNVGTDTVEFGLESAGRATGGLIRGIGKLGYGAARRLMGA